MSDVKADNVTVFTHSSICVRGSRVVYFDPFEMDIEPHDADIVCVTHAHYDHFSPDDLRKVLGEDTTVVFTEDLREAMTELGIAVERQVAVVPGETYEVRGLALETVASYNLDKDFHPRANGWVGYVLSMDGVRYYVAGDTDLTPEAAAVECNIALVPAGGTYTTTALEAAELVNTIAPAIAIPTHYGSVTGTAEDGAVFQEHVSPAIRVELKL